MRMVPGFPEWKTQGIDIEMKRLFRHQLGLRTIRVHSRANTSAMSRERQLRVAQCIRPLSVPMHRQGMTCAIQPDCLSASAIECDGYRRGDLAYQALNLVEQHTHLSLGKIDSLLRRQKVRRASPRASCSLRNRTARSMAVSTVGRAASILESLFDNCSKSCHAEA